MTERDIQMAIYWYRRLISSFPLVLNNVYIWSWESDMAFISDSGFVTEWEIKVSRANFFADFKKPRHKLLQASLEDHNRLSRIEYARGPKYFYYACPKDMIKPEEVPPYAGLCYVSSQPSRYAPYEYMLSVVKDAPRRSVPGLPPQKVEAFLKKGLARYWDCKVVQRHYEATHSAVVRSNV